ncbi:Mariner Mos1 transposase [Eumeta japonica]|uniref:Mariner Mos1 transposase n=1 Tax=Eumeta variegata TaxID=151549 RepID=A0A4C1X7I5_EUMVA|nr:Mariner Mos1 transposase [Eumeta japonica]
MRCVLWNWKDIIHYKLLPSRKTINPDFYCEQLTRLKQEIKKIRPESVNRKGVAFHHDSSSPHTSSLATQQILREFGWKAVLHPAYSPDLVSSDFHLFCSLQNSLRSVKLTSREDCPSYLL